jgi:glycosyltransferase involved in cell wall biosynthesis
MFHPIIIMARCYALIKKLIKAESIDLIHGHWIYPDCVAAVWIARSLSIPVVVSARGCDINLYKDYRVRRLQIMSALKHADAITAVSDSLRNTIINDFRIDAKKAVTIRNGVDPNQFKRMTRAKARTIVGLRQGVKYLIFVGALDEVKGLNYLIRALGDLKKSGDLAFHTLFIGEGPEREQIQKQIIQLGLRDEVELIGAKPHEEIPIWMNACDVLCLPSIREGTPNVIIEALACGLPVVATNVGGIPEIVKKSNAILVPPKDTRSLAHAVYTFFSGERQNNRSPIAVSTWRDCAQKYVDLYLSVLRERGSGFHTQKNTLSGV